MFRTLLKHIRALVQSDTASVILLEGESLLSVRAVDGYEKWTDPTRILSFKVEGKNNPFYQKLISTRKSLLIRDTAKEPNWEVYPGTEPVRSCIFAPIVIEEKIMGVVGLSKTEANYFTEEHVQWAEALVGHAAVAIQNAWLFEQVRAGRERMQSLSHRLVEIQESERQYVARELHDEVGQALTSLMVDLRFMEKRASNPSDVIRTAAEMEATLSGVIENLHRIAMALRPASLDHLGLVAALRQHVESMGKKFGLKVQFNASGIRGRLSSNMEIVLYRIVQEALTNVAKHAHASRVDVVLKKRNDKLVLIIEDDGVGFNPEAVASEERLGIYGMRERADMIDGKLIIESAPGRGTTIMVEVHYADPIVDR